MLEELGLVIDIWLQFEHLGSWIDSKANPVYIEFQEPVSKILITTPKGHTVGWERKEKWIWEELVEN